MSVIGEYVHLKAANYMRYGITRKKEQSPTSQLAAFKTKLQTQAMIATLNKEQIQKLQDDYNSQTAILANALNNEEIEVIQKLILQSLDAKFGTNIPEEIKRTMQFNFANGSIGVVESVDGSVEKLKQVRQLDTTRYTFVDTVTKRITDLQTQIDRISDATTKENLQSLLNNAQSSLESAITSANGLTAKDQKIFGAALQGHNASDLIIPNDDAKRVVSELRTIVALLQIPNLSNWLGEFEELIARYVSLKIQNVATNDIIQIFQKEIASLGSIQSAGSNNVKVEFSMGDLINLNQSSLQELKKGEFKTTLINKHNKLEIGLTSSATSKADAYFNIETYGLVGASIKNINMSSARNISLVSGTPLLPFLMGLNNSSMATHYLNILAEHTDDNISGLSSAKSIAAEGLTYGFLYFALSGRGGGRTGGFADIFILNDSSNKSGNSARIFDIGTLISGITKLRKLNSVEINGDDALIYWQSVKLLNNFVEDRGNQGASIQSRLSKLIAAAHKEKLSLSLSKDIFNSVMI